MELLSIKGDQVRRGYRVVAVVAAVVTALTTFAQPANAAITPATTTWEWPGYDWANPPFQGTPPTDLPPNEPTLTICANAHLAGIGWQGWQCGDSVEVGTTGQSRRMEALALWSPIGQFAQPGSGRICAQAHVAGLGWMTQDCGGSWNGITVVGTTGQSRQMEAVGIGMSDYGICVNAHVAYLGWAPAPTCVGAGQVAIVGTTGQSRQMEALTIAIN
jgi:hypothetical protein